MVFNHGFAVCGNVVEKSRMMCKCLACSLPTYFMPKTFMRQNLMHLVWCVHKPGLNLFCMYPFFARCCSRSSCANSPACGKPYMPFQISTYTHPSLVAFFCNSYCCWTSSKMSLILSWRYSYHLSGGIVIKKLDVHGHKFGLGNGHYAIKQ